MAGSKDSQLSPLASSSRRNNAWHDVLETLGCIGSPAAAGLRAESLACIDVGDHAGSARRASPTRCGHAALGLWPEPILSLCSAPEEQHEPRDPWRGAARSGPECDRLAQGACFTLNMLSLTSQKGSRSESFSHSSSILRTWLGCWILGMHAFHFVCNVMEQ